MPLALLIFLFSYSLQAYSHNVPSGHEVANGGSFLECDSTSTTGPGVFSLDRIEGENLHSLPPAFHLKKFEKEEEIFQTIINDLRATNPERAQRYESWYQQLSENRVFVKDLGIKPVPDSGAVLVPAGCKLSQGAVFMTEKDGTTGRFLYDENLWNLASPLDRAYLILHEIIYREAKLPENAHVNSMATRYLNAYLMANNGFMRGEELLQILIKTKFRSGEYRGVPLILTQEAGPQSATTPIEYFKNSLFVKKAVLDDSFRLRIGKKTISRTCHPERKSNQKINNSVEFYSRGSIKKLIFEVFPDVPGCEGIDGSNILEFDESGEAIVGTRN